MAEYYVVRDKNTGLYFRGKGVNRWGKYYNQASVYRIRANAENAIKEVSWRGEEAEVVPIQIVETTADVAEVKHGTWIGETDNKGVGYAKCSACGGTMSIFCYGHDYCPRCGAKMDGERKE